MIYTHIPYAPRDHNLDLGWAYANFMDKLGIDDWACFMDHDAMFTTINWHQQLMDIISLYPEAGCFTCMTNRVGNPIQIAGYDMGWLANESDPKQKHRKLLYAKFDNHDIRNHRKIGKGLFENYYSDVMELDANHLMSGVLILISKKIWKTIKYKSGFLGIDNDLHSQCLKNGYKVYLMKGVYVYHWYRGDGDYSHVLQTLNLK